MNKKRTLWILLDLVFLIVFNVVFFVAGGTDHPASAINGAIVCTDHKLWTFWEGISAMGAAGYGAAAAL